MIYLLHGPNAFLRNKKLKEIEAAYRKKHPDALGFARLDATECGLEDFQSAVTAQGLFEQSRFVVVRNGFAAWGQEALHFVKERGGLSRDAQTVIVFVENALPGALLSDIKRIATLQEFRTPSPQTLRRFIQKEISERDGQGITPNATEKLVAVGKNDFWKLANVLEEVLLYTYNKTGVSEDDVDLFVRKQNEQTVFPLGDAVLSFRRQQAVVFCEELVAQGEDPKGIAQYVIWLARAFLAAAAAHNERVSEQAAATALSLHPYVARKLFSFARAWNEGQHNAFAREAMRLDRRRLNSSIPVRLAVDAF